MGSVIARDLREDAEHDLVLLDRAASDGIAAVEAADPQALMLALDGCGFLVNAASYRFNLLVMDAALAAGCGYVDLGGLYHVAAQQYARSDDFEERGLLAILGCGAGPGKTNLMAARAARELDVVTAVRCASAGYDEAGPSIPYARETLLDELREPPIVVRDGEHVALAPLTSGGPVPFPEPVGTRETLHTLHSEALTLAESLGAHDVDFRLGLHPEVRDALESGRDLPAPSARTWSTQYVEVGGLAGDAAAGVVMTAVTRPHDEWAVGGGAVSTAAVAAAVARLYARGALGAQAGCLPPERALDPDEVFAELEARGCSFEIEMSKEVAPR